MTSHILVLGGGGRLGHAAARISRCGLDGHQGELSEVAYLWSEAHRIDGTKPVSAIGAVPHTPLDVAIARALEDLGKRSDQSGAGRRARP